MEATESGNAQYVEVAQTSLLPVNMSSSSLPWEWILEKLLELKQFSSPYLKEIIINYIPDIEEPRCSRLIQKVALRYLEDIVLSRNVDVCAIPLIKMVTKLWTKPNSRKSSFVKERLMRDLVLRVQTEAVLTNLRLEVDNGTRDWEAFSDALNNTFPEGETEPSQGHRRTELASLLQIHESGEEKEALVLNLLKKYPLEELLRDLLLFIEKCKTISGTPCLTKLAKDVKSGAYFPSSPPLSDHNFTPKKNGHVDPNEIRHNEINSHSNLHLEGGDNVSIILPDIPADNNAVQISAVEAKNAGSDQGKGGKLTIEETLKGSGDVPSRLHTSFQNQDKEVTRESMDRREDEDMHMTPYLEEESERNIGQSIRRIVMNDLPIIANMGVETAQKGGEACKESAGQLRTSSNQHQIKEWITRPENTHVTANFEERCKKKQRTCYLDKSRVERADTSNRQCDKCRVRQMLLLCHGCSIAIHFTCLKRLGMQQVGHEDWYCPVCQDRKAREALRKAQQEAEGAQIRLDTFLGICESSDERCCDPGTECSESQCADKMTSKHDLTDGVVMQSQHTVQTTVTDNGEPRKEPETTRCSSRSPENRRRDFVMDKVLLAVQDNQPILVDQGGVTNGKHTETELNLRSCSPSRTLKKRNRSLPASSNESTDLVRPGSHEAGSSKLASVGILNVERQEVGQQDGDPGEEYGINKPSAVCESEGGGKTRAQGRAGSSRVRRLLDSGRKQIPGLRRKVLPWTKLEEDVLKEGVSRYSNDGTWGFQWRNILEFGVGKFDPSRTPIDLKDKWRNMVKSVS